MDIAAQRRDAIDGGFEFRSDETEAQTDARFATWVASFNARQDSNEPGTIASKAEPVKVETAYDRMVRNSQTAHEKGSDSRKGPSKLDPLAADDERRDGKKDAVADARARAIKEGRDAHKVGSPSRITAK